MIASQEIEQALVNAGAVFGPHVAYPQDSLPDQFEAQARVHPGEPAVLFESEGQACTQLTYHELNLCANALAHRLHTQWQIAPGDPVGVCLAPSLEGVLAFLALGKLRAVPYFLDPLAPPERLAFLLKDAACRLLLVQASGGNGVSSFPPDAIAAAWPGGSMLPLDETLVALNAGATENPTRPGSLDDLAYMLATSGTTGVPKAVLVRWRSLVNYVASLVSLFQVQPGDRILNIFSLHFDPSLAQIALALSSGATLYMGERSVLASGHAIFSFLQRHAITHATFTPSLLATVPYAMLPALRSVECGGERCPRGLAQTWGQAGRMFVNKYGPTECAVGTLYWECLPDEQGEIPIGRPIPNTWACILDEHGHPGPRGQEGEIGIGGVGVSSYLNRPDLNAQQFIALWGERCYRTGDRGFIDEKEGVVWFRGRSAGDLQVKLSGGRRFDLGEIEIRLLEHPDVLACAVQQVEGHLVVYLTAHRQGRRPSVQELQTHLARWVPSYAIPHYFVWQEALPMSSTGKIDRRALRSPDWKVFARDGELVHPRTPMESTLAALVASILNPLAPPTDSINILQTFGQLGLDSLSVTDLLLRVGQVFGSDGGAGEGEILRMPLETYAHRIDASSQQARDELPVGTADQGACDEWK